MSTQTPTGCPAWCDRTHESHVHRREVGPTKIGDWAAQVVILQTPDGEPTLALSAPGFYVELQIEDHDDVAWLFDRLGRDDIARLVDSAARILAESTP